MTLPRNLRPAAKRSRTARLVFVALLLTGLVGVRLSGTPTPIGYWRFEEGPADSSASGTGTILDASPSGDHATPAGGPTYRTDVPANPIPQTGTSNTLSLEFDGVDDKVVMGSAFPFNQPGDVTLELWLKYDGADHDAVLWGRPDEPLGGNRFHLYVNQDATIGFDYAAPTGAFHPVVGAGNPSGGAPIPLNVWTHVAITRSGNTYRSYVDGVLKTEQVDGSPDLPTSVGWSLSGRGGFMFNGGLDEFRMSSGALDPGQFLRSPSITLVVNSTADPGSGACDVNECTLREAIAAANGSAGADTITFAGISGTIDLTGPLPDLTDHVTITGPGASVLTVRRDTGGDYRVFTVGAGVNVSISDLSIANGTAFNGGGILNAGVLTLSRSVVSGNSVSGLGANGGGIHNTGSLTVSEGTILGNGAPNWGGGIFNDGGTLDIDSSTFTGNAAIVGGGIFNTGTLTLRNSTISGNDANNNGGGLRTATTAAIYNSTIFGNRALTGRGGGIRHDGGTLFLSSTIVAGNTAATAGPDMEGSASGDYNLVENTADASLAGTHNVTGVTPLVDALDFYGGPTKTHRLQAGSPAIDQGISNTFATDQRGLARTLDNPGIPDAAGGDSTDIGAYERGTAFVSVTNTSDTGAGSLRDAIDQANSDNEATVIRFPANLAGQTITPVTPLPTLVEGSTTIDGDVDNNCQPDIAIDGSVVGGTNIPGMSIASNGNVIRGLAITRFGGAGISIQGGDGNVVECNHIGTDLTGTLDRGNTGSGIHATNGANDNRIGPGNVIAYNAEPGAPIGGVAVLDGTLPGAYPLFSGLTPAYTNTFPIINFPNTSGPFQSSDGITPTHSGGQFFSDNFGARFTGTVSVSSAGTYTFTVQNPDDLVRIVVDGQQVIEAGCCNPSQSANIPLGMGGHAIEIAYLENNGAHGFAVQIDGPGAAALSSGGQPGLFGEVFPLRVPSERNTITQNSIFANDKIGIYLDHLDIGDRGSNVNDPGDGDIGPNTALNYPEITTVVDNGGGQFMIQGTAPADAWVELFGNPAGSPRGEGRVFLISTLTGGNGSFSTFVTMPPGLTQVTATATDPTGNTSEFSPGATANTTQPSRWASTPIFSNIPDIAGPIGYLAGDLDNDGDLDLVGAGQSAGQCRLLVLKQQNGQYNGIDHEPMGAGEGLCDAKQALALGDVNSDGWLDLVAQGRTNAAPRRLLLFLNNGSGMLVQQADIDPGGFREGAVALGDVDSDGDLDLAVSGRTGSGDFPAVRLYANNGAGGFSTVATAFGSVSGITQGSLSFGDLDADGDLDLVASGRRLPQQSILQVFVNDGGTFSDGQRVLPDYQGIVNSQLSLADLDQDGLLDIVAAGDHFDGVGLRRVVMQVMNGGGATFSAPQIVAEIPNGFWAGIALGDVDGDGYPEGFVSGYDGAFRLFYLENQGGSLVVSTDQPGGTFVGPVVFGDFDADADLDMVGLPVRQLFENQTGPANEAPTAPTGLTQSTSPTGEAILSWSATDAETATDGLSYQIRVGTVPGQYDVISGVYGTPFMGTHPTGRNGQGQPGRRLRLAPGTKYWQVRAIDSGLLPGPWSQEASFAAVASIAISDVTVTEGDAGTSNATFNVTLSGPAAGQVTVDFQTIPGTADADVDYITTTGTVSFDPGETSKPIAIPIVGDASIETIETFNVILTNPTNAVLFDAQATGTILDDDVGIAIADAERAEGFSGASQLYFLVSLTKASTETINVSFATTDGSATTPGDYGFSSGMLTFFPGQLTQTFTVNINGDTAIESNESFTVTLTNPVNGVLIDATAIGTILDDDATIPPASRLTWQLAQEGPGNLRGVASNGAIYVAVGEAGSIYTSPNGTVWTRRTNPNPFASPLNAVAFAGGQFVAVGECCVSNAVQILTSTDGITWTPRTAPTVGNNFNQGLQAVVLGGAGTYVAVGRSGRILSSVDGSTWTERQSGTNQNLNGVAYGNGIFIAVGDNRTIRISSDGISWASDTGIVPVLGNPQLSAITFTSLGNQFVMAGSAGIFTSPDGAPNGASWTQVSTRFFPMFSGVASSAGVIVAAGGGSLQSSADGTNWTDGSMTDAGPGVSRNLFTVGHGPAGFVAVGAAGAIYLSDNGANPFESQTFTTSRQFRAMAAGSGVFCAIGDSGTVATSSDGILWANGVGLPPPFGPGGYDHWAGLVFTGSEFVGVGASAAIMASADCINWTDRNPSRQPPSGSGFVQYRDLAQGPGALVAVGERFPPGGGVVPIIVSSSDGLTWSEQNPAFADPFSKRLIAVGFGNGRFVAIGRSDMDGKALLVRSADGQAWTEHPASSFGTDSINDIAFGNGVFVAVGSRTFSSVDGLGWTLRLANITLTGVTFDVDRFVAVGPAGVIFTSPDGTTWTPNTSPTRQSLSAVSFNPSAGRFAAAGSSAIIYSAGNELPAIAVSDANVVENAGTATFVVTMSSTSDQDITVSYNTAGYTATSDADFQSISDGVLVIPANTASPQMITVTVIDDQLSEDQEVFFVQLSNPTNAVFADPLALGTIVDNEPVGIAISDATTTEGISGQTNATFFVSLTRPSGSAITVNFSTVDGSATAPPDYAFRSGTLTFNPGSRTQIVSVPIIGDATSEPAESFEVRLFAPANAILADDTGLGTIQDDDAVIAPPSRAIWSVAFEGMPSIRGVAASASTHVAVGDYGYIWTSPDGVSWTRQANPDGTRRNLNAVAYDGTQFIAVGDCCVTTNSPAILTSPDGVTWTLRSPPTGTSRAHLFAISVGNGQRVAVGQFGRVMTSPDGMTWTDRPSGTNSDLRGVAFGNGLFVAVGGNRTIRISNDGGQSWVQDTGIVPVQGNPNLSGITFTSIGGGQFVMVSSAGIFTSPNGAPNGASWSHPSQTFFPTLSGVTSAAGLIVAAGGGTILTSPDATAWTPTTLSDAGPGVSRNLFTVAHGPSGFVATGASGAIYTSPDGMSAFTSRTLSTSRLFRGIAYGNGTYCAVGGTGTVATSPDGVVWTNRVGLLAPFGPGSYDSWNSVIFDGAEFVAVGQASAVMRSNDCIAWTDGNPGRMPAGSPPYGASYNDVVTGNGLVVAVGAAFPPQQTIPFIATSFDGMNWASQESGLTFPVGKRLSAVAFDGNRFVAVGHDQTSNVNQPVVTTSDDGFIWTERLGSFLPNQTVNDVTFGQGLFVAVGSQIWTSPDGIDWTPRFSQGIFNGVTLADGRFIAVGLTGVIATSLDGISWTSNTSPTAHTLNAVAHNPVLDRSVAVGDSAAVYSSRDEAPVISVGDVTVTEGAGGFNAVFTVTLSSTSALDVTVQFNTADGSATGGQDYSPTTGVVTFPAGSTTPQSVAVPILGDAIAESAAEIFSLQLNDATNAVIAGDATGVGTILDDDGPTVRIGDRAITEGNTGTTDAIFSVFLTRASATPVEVSYQVVGGTAEAGSDFQLVSGTLTLAPGSTGGQIRVRIIGDTDVESSSETFVVNITNVTGAALEDAQGAGTILDDDAVPQAVWTRAQEGMPTIRAATVGAKKFVIVGDYGHIWTSFDTISWTNVTQPAVFRSLRGVAFGGGQFVAVGQGAVSAEVLSSADAVTWEVRDVSGVAQNLALNAVAHGGGQFVAVGNAGLILTSPDGAVWTRQTSNLTSSLNAVAYGGAGFVAVGVDRTVLFSSDGTNWTAQSVPASISPILNAVVHTGSQFVVVGNLGGVLTSPDGSVWTQRFPGVSTNLLGVAWGGGLIAAAGGGTVVTSPDGIAWTSRQFSPNPSGHGTARALNAVVFGTPGFAVTTGFLAVGNGGGIYHSTDGAAIWNSRTLLASRSLRSVAASTIGYCAVGNFGSISRSIDGAIWSNETGLSVVPNQNWTSVARGAGQFVAVGNQAEIMTSPDCVTWTERNAGRLFTPATGITGLLSDVIYVNGRFVAVGSEFGSDGVGTALIAVSDDDGITWTRANAGLTLSADHGLEAVAHGGGVLVAIGRRADGNVDITTSPDGVSWTPVTTTVFDREAVLDITYGQGLFVAAGSRIWTSPDGVNWTKVSDLRNLNGVAFANGAFVAVGAFGTIYTSLDGADWVQNTVPTNNSLLGVAHSAGLGRFVAVGDSAIVYSGGIPPLQVSIADASVAENAGNAQFAVNLSRKHPGQLTVEFATANGFALAPGDYASASGTLTFTPGQTTQPVTVAITDDAASEDTETFFVTLANPSAGLTIADALGVGTINDDEPLAASISQSAVREGTGGQTTITFQVALTRAATSNVSVDFTTVDGDATSADYAFRSGTLFLGPGTRTATVRVPIVTDATPESDEFFTVHLLNPVGVVIATGSAQGKIIDDDAAAPPPVKAMWTVAQEGMATIRGLASNGSIYVGVGDYGQIWSSTDGISWTRRANPDSTLRNLFGITYANGQFVAVGDCCVAGSTNVPAVLTSSDGVNWTLRPTSGASGSGLQGVAFGGGTFVAVGRNGRVMTSPDASSWTDQTPPTSQQLNGLGFGGAGLFVAVGSNRTILSSPNGIAWSPAATIAPIIVPTTTFSHVRFTTVGNRFVVVGSNGITTSVNGTDWIQAQPAPFSTGGIAEGGGRVVTVGAGANAARTSTDGVNWPATVIFGDGGPGAGRSLLTIAFGNAGFVAAGTSGAIYQSSDGVTQFQSQTQPTSRSFRGVVYGNGAFCAIGDNGAVARSVNGTAWTNVAGLPPSQPGSHDPWRSITFDGSKFVAVGLAAAVMTSPDCSGWTDGNANNQPLGGVTGSEDLFDVTLGNGLLVVVGERRPAGSQIPLPAIATSSDGNTWIDRDPALHVPTNRTLSAVAFGNGQFVAIGRRQSGELAAVTSSDGITWTERFYPEFVAESPSDVTFGNGLFVAVGARIWTSPDLNTWTLRSSPVSLNGVTFGNGRFVAVGPSGVIVTSTDGAAWTQNTSPTVHSLNVNGVAYSTDLDRFVGVGDSAIIFSGANEAPVIAIGSVTVTETDAAGVNAVFNVSLSSTTPQQVTASFATADGSATAAGDYTASTGSVVFAAGSSTPQQIVIPITGDLIAEANEQFFVALSNPINAAMDPAGSAGIGTILDNETPALIVRDRTIGEGNAGTTLALFTVQLTRPTIVPVTFSYATAAGTAGSNDYVTASGTATIPAGSVSTFIAVSVVGDTRNEPNETFFVNLSAPVNATIQDGQGLGTIIDDETAPVAQWTRAQEGMPMLRAAAFDGTQYVVAGDYGDIWTSADTVAWTNRSIPLPYPNGRQIRGLVHAGGQFVAVGQRAAQPEALTSPDAVTWTSRDLSGIQPSGTLLGVAHGNGVYAAVGLSGIATSPDGVTWTLHDSGTPSQLNAIAFGGGAFVAVGTERAIVRSTDGIVWTPQIAPSAIASSLNAITHTGSQFVAVGAAGSVITSPDGVNWTRRFVPTNAALAGVTTGGGQILAVGGGVILTSTDAMAWTSRSFATTAGNGVGRGLQTAVFGAAGFVAVGVSGQIYTSPDGIASWASQTLTTSRNFMSVAAGTPGFCAVGNFGTVASSVDGLAWTNRTGIVQAANNFWRAVAFGNGQFVAVGNLAEIMSSSDCVSWTERNAGRLNQFPGLLRDVTFANGRFVAVGSAATTAGPDAALVMTSTDGVTWTSGDAGLTASADRGLETVAFGAGKFVAIGRRTDQGVDVVTSVDGQTWSAIPTTAFDQEAVVDLVFANNQFVAGGSRVWTSPDGVTWTKVADVQPINALVFADGLIVGASFGGGLFSSIDAINWVQGPAETGHSVFGVTYSTALDRFVAVGDSTIVYSSGIAPPTISIDDVAIQEGDSGQRDLVFTVTLSRPASQNVRVDYTTADGTATVANGDYQAKSGSLTFNAGVTSEIITVRINGDFNTEANETFVMNLSGALNATVSDAQGVGTIVNDDITPAVSVADASVVEGDSNRRDLVFAVTLSSPARQRITVNYSTADGTALIANNDYLATSGTVTFNAGESQQLIIVKVNGDVDVEPNETLLVNLSAPVGMSIADGQGVGTIITDDFLPTVTISDGAIVEGNSGRRDFFFTLSLSAPAKKPVNVSYTTSNGSAVAPSDYVATSGTVQFKVGSSTATVLVRVNGDRTFEGDETFFLNLTGVTDGVIGDAQGMCTIRNDDVP